MPSPGLLEGKVAIITGAASGIGRSTALLSAREGAHVVIADINAAGAAVVEAQASAFGRRALALRVDVSDPGDLSRMVAAAVAEFGRIDLLVNNAADLSQNLLDGGLLETEISVWDRVYVANLRSVVVACRLAVPHMLENGAGVIINVSSVQSLMGDLERTAYSVAKAGMNSLTRSIAAQFGKQNIRCNAVLPGPVMNREAGKQWPAALLDSYRAQVLTPDVGSPDEIGELIVFLASDRASFVTGQLIAADGGFATHMPYYLRLLRGKH